MAQLAIAGVAAAAGLGIGAAAGLTTFAALATAASIGFSVGWVAGGYLFPPKVTQEGARINDLAVTSSAFGAVRPVVYGRVRIGGNIIWSTPIKEVRSESRHGSKGGKGGKNSVTSITYSYFGNFALAMCEGPIDGVLRIWADSKLIYDASSNTGGTPLGPDLPAQQQILSSNGLKFRFYPGTEDQTPDSLIQADKGVENVPAYRGTCYIVFEDLPLANYGNRLPNITCEIYQVQRPDYPYQTWTQATNPDTIFGSTGHTGLAVDWDRNLAYWQGDDPFGLIVTDAVSLRTIREVPMTEVLTAGDDGGISAIGIVNPNILVGPDGALYFAVSGRNVRVDQNTLKETAEFPTGTWVDFSDEHFGQPTTMGSLSYYDTTGKRRDVLIVGNYFGNWGALSIPEMTFLSRGSFPLANCQGIVSGKVELGTGDAWVMFGPAPIGGGPILFGHIVGTALGFETSTTLIYPNQFDPSLSPGIFSPGQYHVFLYDESDDSLIFSASTEVTEGSIPVHAWMAKWSPVSGLVWKTEVDNGPSGNVSNQARISGGTLGVFMFNKVVQFDTATGKILHTYPAGTVPGDGFPFETVNGIQVYDSVTQAVLGSYSLPGSYAKAFLGRGSGESTTLGDIVSDQCQRAGFTVADFDVSTLTDVIEGYVITQRATVTDILSPLIGAFLVDAVESDYMLKFKHRGAGVVAAVSQDKLIRDDVSKAEPYIETRQQEIELPMRLTMTYMDHDRDYQTNTAAVKRIRNPDPVVYSDNQIDVQLAIVSTSTPAKQMTEKLLFTAWNERHTFSTRLSPEFDYLDPTDAVTLTLNDGYTARMRVGPTNLGVDYSLEAKLIGETDGQYISTAEADPGVPWIGSHYIHAAGKSQLIMLDTPLLRDVDDMGGRAVRGYWAGSPFARDIIWPGAVLQQADPASSLWTTLDATTSEATWGYVETPPADWSPVFATQDEEHGGIMIVGIVGGMYEPSSITDVDMANFVNPMALLKENGQVEIIQYRDAVTLGPGRYQLSTLRRGQRGTDTMAFGHTAGEHFVILDPALLNLMQVQLSQRNLGMFYRLVTVGMIPEDALVDGFTFHGRDQMPYAPVNAERSHVGADGVLTWIRRTRIGGMMEDGTDTAPLGEVSEEYEVYLLRTEADAVDFDPTDPATYMRAFVGLTSPTLTYTAAMMTADGFDPVTDTAYAVIYQLNAIVGRGFSSLHVLPPPGGGLVLGLEDGTGGWDGWLWG
jgi:hypothetical protein